MAYRDDLEGYSYDRFKKIIKRGVAIAYAYKVNRYFIFWFFSNIQGRWCGLNNAQPQIQLSDLIQ